MQVRIERLDNDARGVTRIEDKITFVSKVLPDELVEIKKIQEEKKFNIASLVEVVEPSEKRIDSKCPYFYECGGCDLWHVDYQNELAYKKEMIQQLLKKNLNVEYDFEIISLENQNYRNKISLKIIEGKIGYFKEKTHDLIEIDYCLIAQDSINNFISDIKLLNILNGEIVIRSNYNNELLITISTKDELVIDIDAFRKRHRILGIILNDKIIYGESKFIEKIDEYFFNISYDSFFQVNRNICQKIFELVSQEISKDDKVLDLYCGVGTLSIISSYNAKKVVGVEIVANAIKNALVNAKINKRKNLEFILGNTNNVVKKLKNDFNTVIVDPPRNGLDQNTTSYLIGSNANKIIYISCNPITLMRDLKLLNDKYQIKKVEVLDMFPRTKHVECVVLLSLNENETAH